MDLQSFDHKFRLNLRPNVKTSRLINLQVEYALSNMPKPRYDLRHARGQIVPGSPVDLTIVDTAQASSNDI
jgi:dihydroorotase-like cyclic amidohydrolase